MFYQKKIFVVVFVEMTRGRQVMVKITFQIYNL